MELKESLKRIEQVREEIKKSYVELDRLKKEVVKELVESGSKTVDLEGDLHATLVWVVEKKIDYDKLQKEYEDIYVLGLRPSFSKTQALNSVSAPLLNKILKDCTITEMGYELKTKREN
jgi:predicted phage-related endonuclease